MTFLLSFLKQLNITDNMNAEPFYTKFLPMPPIQKTTHEQKLKKNQTI